VVVQAADKSIGLKKV